MNTPPYVGPTNLTATTLKLVRYAMLTALLLFGGIAYWQSTNRTEPLPPPDDALRLVGYALCVAAIVAMAVIRGIRARAEGAARLTWSLVGSAFAEGAALFGAVYVFLGGQPWIYALGLAIFIATWAVLPADPDAV
jgi:O-antigen/teichoic acid export membrane protein